METKRTLVLYLDGIMLALVIALAAFFILPIIPATIVGSIGLMVAHRYYPAFSLETSEKDDD